MTPFLPPGVSKKERPRYATLDNELDATKKEIGVAAQADFTRLLEFFDCCKKMSCNSNMYMLLYEYGMSVSKKRPVSRFCLGLSLSALNIARSTRPLGRFLQSQLLKQACRVRPAYFCSSASTDQLGQEGG